MQLASLSPTPIEIVYTGLRSGEKLHEDLFNDGEIGERAVHPLIFHVQVPALDKHALDGLAGVDEHLAKQAMLEIVVSEMTLRSVDADSGSTRD